ncbi:Protein unc-1 [Meloidogyne graminicola]|uniref:Protein unc-1 n=1 Tax=Meloidogyne graminicola TaxID=189291 RepID=A0A8T0A147_9BILA|nr:Protein unc-1 [Meloidogyne graminicola]
MSLFVPQQESAAPPILLPFQGGMTEFECIIYNKQKIQIQAEFLNLITKMNITGSSQQSLSTSSDPNSPIISNQFRWQTRKSQRRRRRKILQQKLEEQENNKKINNSSHIQSTRKISKTVNFRSQFRPGTPPPSMPIRAQALSYDPKYLAPPTVYELGLTKYEAPPHKRDTVEKIPIRARSQSWLIRTRHLLDDEKLNRQVPIISKCLYILSILLLIITFPFCIPFCLRVSKEYERAVVFRLGRLIKRGTKGPGMFFIMPCIDTYKMVDLRVLSFDVPPQEILSRDSVTVSVEAVIYFRISNPVISVTNVNDAQFSTKLLAQTQIYTYLVIWNDFRHKKDLLLNKIKINFIFYSTLRNVLGTKTLSEILMERDIISNITEKVLDDGTDPWGVKVERVEIKDIRLPQQLMKSMAAEAEAARDARAKIIAADGERSASRQLVQAADIVSGNKVSLHLRYLQTLIRISSQHNHTFVVPIPLEFMKKIIEKIKNRGRKQGK